MRPWKLTLGVVSLLVTLSTALPINLLVPFSVPQVLAQTVEERKAEAERLFQQGLEQLKANQVEVGIKSLEQALIIYREIKYPQREAAVLLILSNIYISQGNYAQAIDYCQQGLTIARELNKREAEGLALNTLGNAYNSLGDYAKAIDYYQQSLAIAQELNKREGQEIPLNNLCTAYFSMDDYAQAIDYCEQSLALARELKNREIEGKALNNLSNAYRSLANYAQAIDYSQQSLALARELKNREGERNALNNLGNAYLSLGDYGKAIDQFEQSLALARELKNRHIEAKVLNNIGTAYGSLGDYSKAINYLQQSLAIARELKDREGEGSVLANLGNAYGFLGDDAKSIDYLQQSLAMARELKNRQIEEGALGNVGNAYRRMGNYTKAIDYLQQSLAMARELKNRGGEGASLGNLGLAYYELGNYTKAIDYQQQSLTIAREVRDINGQGLSLNNLGLALFTSGNIKEAEKILRTGIEIWESQRGLLGGNDIFKVSIFEGQARTYRTLQQVLIAQNKINEALEIAERGRAKAIVDLLTRRLSLQEPTLTPTPSLTIQQIQQIVKSQNITLVQYSIIYDRFKVQGKQETKETELYIWVVKPTGEITFRQVDLKPLWQQQNTSLDELVTNNLELVSAGINRGESDNPTLSNNPPFAPGDLVRLKDDLPNYPAWQVVSVNPQNRTLRLRQPSFKEGVIIERSMADATKVSSPNAQNRSLQQLHKLLIEPIADLLPTDPNARVIFIPQGALFFVPFPALQDADKKFLIEKHTILTAPSIQVLDLTRKQRQRVPGTAKDVLVVGNPIMPEVSPFPGEPARQLSSLPAAEREAMEVATMFKTEALIGSQATKATILPQLPNARIIHLATHGLLDDYTGGGLPGAIALAPSNNDNGLLTASEILDLKLNAELVVLSACNTGKGRITGDGVIGLSRSLISAGVPSVVVSLWSVPDAPTASLMTEFYRQMQKSPDKAQALRQAMLTTIKTHPNPKDWAAFTLIGEAE